MGLFMEKRLAAVGAQALLAWQLGRNGSTASLLMWACTAASGAYYTFLLVKTLQAAVLAPMAWRVLCLLVVSRDLTDEEFYSCDGAPPEISAKRRAALERIATSWKERWPKMHEMSVFLRKHFSDLRFKASGVESTFPIFQRVVNDALDPCTIVVRSNGNELQDVDGQKFLDVCGSYGVNVFGYTRFKQFMAKGNDVAQELGPCLGPMHPLVIDNIKMLLQIFKKEEVSFHMSGTEAVMCAVQQVRFHKRRPLVAVFQGAYHGWWDGVMQGAGNERFNPDCMVLKDLTPASLDIISLRRNEIAAVLVNPMQGFGWAAASTAKLGHAKAQAGADAIERFRVWLCQVREMCTRCDIPLIFDEVWTFQMGPGGAQEVYGVQADIVVLGKSLGGGYAVGAVCGPSSLMERRDPHRPMRVSFVVGTFSAHPSVVGAMNAVLKFVTSPDAAVAFNGLKDRVAKWVDSCNAALTKEGLPIKVAAYRSLWTVRYEQPSPFQFLFQYYLRDAGLQMAWVGTGKLLLNLEFTEKDLDRLTSILLNAAKAFRADGWWWEGSKTPTVAKFVIGPTLRYHAKWISELLGLA